MLTLIIIIELLAIVAMTVSIIRHLVKFAIFTATLTMIAPIIIAIWFMFY